MACFCLLAGAGTLIVSCKKESAPVTTTEDQSAVSQSTLDRISALGFSTAGVRKFNDGYLVEGDILLSEKDLATQKISHALHTPKEEQYSTTNLVTGLPRTITVRVASTLGTAFVTGTDTAIARYNRLNLRITFRRVTSGTANITISGFNQGPSGGGIVLGSAGFPTSSGNPYNSILMNTNAAAYGSNPNVLYVGSVIQHEIGHCIGFRHTDYFNRALSCGGATSNEGTAGVGAVHIPGTPTGNSSNSWMLACSNGGNRTFNAADIVALNYLY
ncbi:zinc-dependent metalloprotease [Chitinophaga sp. B61]|uniref:Zinc-dependent metalloprotease n=2 Tax=Chitinophaga rhizophila TaxID=2866212 RepID=A0ABS7GCL2_9BACT|nr:zinc-dependent metalloprotease [Chitinophaga rhizophila]